MVTGAGWQWRWRTAEGLEKWEVKPIGHGGGWMQGRREDKDRVTHRFLAGCRHSPLTSRLGVGLGRER